MDELIIRNIVVYDDRTCDSLVYIPFGINVICQPLLHLWSSNVCQRFRSQPAGYKINVIRVFYARAWFEDTATCITRLGHPKFNICRCSKQGHITAFDFCASSLSICSYGAFWRTSYLSMIFVFLFLAFTLVTLLLFFQRDRHIPCPLIAILPLCLFLIILYLW